MQLSPFFAPTLVSPAVSPGLTPAGFDGTLLDAPAVGGRMTFARLFPNLASADQAGSNPPLPAPPVAFATANAASPAAGPDANSTPPVAVTLVDATPTVSLTNAGLAPAVAFCGADEVVAVFDHPGLAQPGLPGVVQRPAVPPRPALTRASRHLGSASLRSSAARSDLPGSLDPNTVPQDGVGIPAVVVAAPATPLAGCAPVATGKLAAEIPVESAASQLPKPGPGGRADVVSGQTPRNFSTPELGTLAESLTPPSAVGTSGPRAASSTAAPAVAVARTATRESTAIPDAPSGRVAGVAAGGVGVFPVANLNGAAVERGGAPAVDRSRTGGLRLPTVGPLAGDGIELPAAPAQDAPRSAPASAVDPQPRVAIAPLNSPRLPPPTAAGSDVPPPLLGSVGPAKVAVGPPIQSPDTSSPPIAATVVESRSPFILAGDCGTPLATEAETTAASIPDSAANGTAGRAANVAAVYSGKVPSAASGFEDRSRKTLSASIQEVIGDKAPLGTDAAHYAPVMPASSLSQPQFADVRDHVSALAGPTLPAEPTSAGGLLTPEVAAGAAHRAVNAVLEAAERFAPASSHAVNLQFSVAGSNDLAVRIELRAGEVRATFHTDSPELRTALAREWQAVSGSAAGHALRSVDPVFAPAKATSPDTSSRENAPRQQRDSSARQSDASAPFRGPRPGSVSLLAKSEHGPREPRIAPRATTRWLHTFA